MTKDIGDWLPDATDAAYVEGLAEPLSPALLALEEAGQAHGIPILDRDAGRVLQAVAAGRRRIVEVGTAYGFSTLWLALGQPADGTIVTIDPDRARTDLARGWWRQAGVADERLVVVNRPALEALRDGEPALAGPFDLAFIDALKEEYRAYVEALLPRLAPGALILADNVLWSGRASGTRPAGDDARVHDIRAFNAWILRHPRLNATILPVGDGLLLAGLRDAGA
jgi:caffeoyl-CoA O-methyltransferase